MSTIIAPAAATAPFCTAPFSTAPFSTAQVAGCAHTGTADRRALSSAAAVTPAWRTVPSLLEMHVAADRNGTDDNYTARFVVASKVAVPAETGRDGYRAGKPAAPPRETLR